MADSFRLTVRSFLRGYTSDQFWKSMSPFLKIRKQNLFIYCNLTYHQADFVLLVCVGSGEWKVHIVLCTYSVQLLSVNKTKERNMCIVSSVACSAQHYFPAKSSVGMSIRLKIPILPPSLKWIFLGNVFSKQMALSKIPPVFRHVWQFITRALL